MCGLIRRAWDPSISIRTFRHGTAALGRVGSEIQRW